MTEDYKQLLPAAISLAAQVFEDTNDKGGAPYILHCIRVMQNRRVRSYGYKGQCIAVLHDVLEDANRQYWPDIDDHIAAFGEYVAGGVRALTHQRGDDYLEEYIPQVMQYNVAVAVKLADLEDNMDILRQPKLRDKDLLRLQKYHIAYRMLTKSPNDMSQYA